MAQSMTMAIFLFFNLLSLSPLPSIASSSNGFSLRLIHRDSPHSPLFQPNLSLFERFKKNAQISKARGSYFQQLSEETGNSNDNKLQNDSLRLPLKYYEPIFTVEIGLGTPTTKRSLVFDTGSDLTWTQCKPYLRCFKQKDPLFDVRKSRSYKFMPKIHKLAKSFKCDRFGCHYFVQYYSGQYSGGVASLETFAFKRSSGGIRRIPGLVFGCGTANKGDFGPSKAISGILGMDRKPYSFARQLGGHIKDIFSYCLPETEQNNTKDTYLRFGDEAVIRGANAQRTPFLKTQQGGMFYGLNLNGISIGGQRLGMITQNKFPDGCVIDSGSSISLLNMKAFSVVQDSLNRHFARFKNVRRIVGIEVPTGFLCYRGPSDFAHFPNMTFHFQGADFHVPMQNVFFSHRDFFCLAAIGSKDVTILGAFQQQNKRILYDLKDDMLMFAPEDCSKDGATV